MFKYIQWNFQKSFKMKTDKKFISVFKKIQIKELK